MSPLPDTAAPAIDAAVTTARAASRRWLELPITAKADHLATIRSRFAAVSDDMIAETLAAKGLDARHAGEDWASGPMSVIRTIRFLEDSLRGIASSGRVPLPDSAIRERPDGQVVVDVMPGDAWDRILYRGWSAGVWMDPSVGRGEARDHMGGIHTKPEMARPGVVAVLGAGNVASITPLDIVHQMFVEGRTVVAKCHPINEYIGPHLEHAFQRLVDEGFLRFVYGGPAVGAALIEHPDVDGVHLTGSERTFDAIVWGAGEEATHRRETGQPRVSKPITAELGNVSPVIVVPGNWSTGSIRWQAEHVATQVLLNAGHNCNATEVLILPAEWPQRDEFMEAVADAIGSQPPRVAYYPGSDDRFDRIAGSGTKVRMFGERRLGMVPPAIIEGVDPESNAPAFREEAFCHVLSVTDLEGADPASYLERAVAFCNERLRGTLNATILIDPGTAKSIGPALDRAVSDLRYGTVAVNVWAAAGFPIGVTPWGAYPGHTLQDIQSGIGFVHNARLIDRPQKAVITAPFRLVPAPPWSVFHRRGGPALRETTMFEARPGPLALAKVLRYAVRP
ncbi:MAG TPA: aldehyde dehydrogenase family protein [Acidimicrobiia bacterium]|nr:aldehyde dehydrogenase family protein [Acidimicrobiia bacterium]